MVQSAVRHRGVTPLDIGDEFIDIDGISPSPLKKKMRGSVKSTGDDSDLRKSVTPEAVDEESKSWALVPYQAPIFPKSFYADAAPTTRKFLPRPNAIRDCPPGMRIRGGRPMPERKSVKPIAKKGFAKPKVDPSVAVLPDSDSELGKKQGSSNLPAGEHHEGSSTKSVKNRKGLVPVVKNAKKRPGTKGTEVYLVGTAPELTSDNPRTRVKFVLQQFDNLRRQYLAEEEQRAKVAGASGSKRADFRASATLIDNGCRVNGSESIYGEVPGVEVGDHYYYRMELFVISLHRQSQGGIDYIPASKSQFTDAKGQRVSIAVSVIASGGYEDDQDQGDTLIYTGQGGNNYKGDKRQGLDQELVRGNLALKNCFDLHLPVRVIRGCPIVKSAVHQESPSGKIYYYDGMYDVADCYQEKGSAGFKVWKYKLIRKAGQGELASSLVMFKGKSLPPVLEERGERVIAEDLSNGLEPVKVRVVGFDDDRIPEGFEYITSLKYTVGLPKPSSPKPCSCDRECLPRNGCQCMLLNCGQPYNDDGALLRAKRLVYECSPLCHCRYDSKCINKVTQKGLRYDLEVFKTEGKGWGVRSSNFIPQGSFVCEYIGEIIHETDAEKRVSNDEYMFDLKIPDSMERRFGDVSGLVRGTTPGSTGSPEKDEDDANSEKYTVDANRYGNLARFINHSCDPNLFVQCVLYDHHDHRFPHIMLFASEHISPYKELTYDYGRQRRFIS